MKTSNIIFLGLFMLVITWITIVVIMGHSELSLHYPANSDSTTVEYTTNNLPFAPDKLIIRGNGMVEINSSTDENCIRTNIHSNYSVANKNLNIELDSACLLTLTNTKNIYLSGNISATFSGIKTDSLFFEVAGNTALVISDINVDYLEIKASDNSAVTFSKNLSNDDIRATKIDCSENAVCSKIIDKK